MKSWAELLREIRSFATELPAARFYMLSTATFVLVLAWILKGSR